MTSEEAISLIDRIIGENGIYGTSPLTNNAIEALRTAISALELSLKEETSDKWISVKEHGNPKEYTEAWVYTEDGRVADDNFHPRDVGAEYSSNVWEGKRTSDGWYQNGTNLPGQKVIYWMPNEPPEPPLLKRRKNDN